MKKIILLAMLVSFGFSAGSLFTTVYLTPTVTTNYNTAKIKMTGSNGVISANAINITGGITANAINVNGTVSASALRVNGNINGVGGTGAYINNFSNTDTNGYTALRISNVSAGGASNAGLTLSSNSTTAIMTLTGSGWNNGVVLPKQTIINNNNNGTDGTSGSGIGLFTAYGAPIRFHTNGNSVWYNTASSMVISGNGNVGIGTTAPTTKLEVAGAVSASALQVNGAISIASSTLSTGGIRFGADVNLYRSAVDILKTDDRLEANDFGSGLVEYKSPSVTTDIIGWSSFSANNPEIKYHKVGKLCTVFYHIIGTSSSTVSSFTLPFQAAVLGTGLNYIYNIAANSDNGGTSSSQGTAYIASGGTTLTLYKDAAASNWTASGSKYVIGMFTYPTEN